MNDQEIEVKFYVHDLLRLEQRLVELGAQLSQPRSHEINLRFDTSDGALQRNFQVLRLRQDTAARLTYKGPGVVEDGVRTRQEIEFTVSNFHTARLFLEALGYRVAMVYEKYRAVYDLGDLHIALDELPYGKFLEIEGPNVAAIQSLNARLGLKWEMAVEQSYTALFDALRQRLNLAFGDLVFENFAEMSLSPQMLAVQAADE